MPRPHARTPADCCDGSDEAQGCENACLERNLHAQEELRRQIGEVQAALDTRKQYAASAIGKVDEMRAKLAGIDGEIAAAEKEVERLAGEIGVCVCVCVCGWVGVCVFWSGLSVSLCVSAYIHIGAQLTIPTPHRTVWVLLGSSVLGGGGGGGSNRSFAPQVLAW
jgi:hypothetical protein